METVPAYSKLEPREVSSNRRAAGSVGSSVVGLPLHCPPQQYRGGGVGVGRHEVRRPLQHE